MDKIQVNVTAKVRNADIRRVMHNNREHIIVPSYTLPDECVMNGGRYPAEEIEKAYKTLEGTLAPIGHPTLNGAFVPANTPEAINAHHVGAWNKTVERNNGRVYIEKWIDVQSAEQSEAGQALLAAIDEGKPIHTSTGLMCQREMVSNQGSHTWVARNMLFDHDAILLDEPGAATPEEGVGLLVNKAEMVVNAMAPEMVTNAILTSSYRQKNEALGAAIRERFGATDRYAYVEDFDASTVIYATNDGLFSLTFEWDGDNPVLGQTPEAVKTKLEYVARNAKVVTEFAVVKNAVQCKPVQANKPDLEKPKMDETKIAELVTNAVKPFSDQLAAAASTIAQLQSQLTANADQADQANRDVILAKAPSLKLTVNALKGEALAELAAQYQTAAPIKQGEMETNSKQETVAGQFAAYQGA